MDNKVDWTTWAEHAELLTCPACSREFRPNHPRRVFCGLPDCPGRQRRPTPSARRPRARRRLRAVTSNAIAALLAETALELHAHPTAATDAELIIACADLARTVRQRGSAGAERALLVRLLAIASVRATP
jgi:hypothetical protein